MRRNFLVALVMLTILIFLNSIQGQENHRKGTMIDGHRIIDVPIYNYATYTFRQGDKKESHRANLIFTIFPFQENEKRTKCLEVSVNPYDLKIRERTDGKLITTLDAVVGDNLDIIQETYQYAESATLNVPKEDMEPWRQYLTTYKNAVDLMSPIEKGESGIRNGEHKIIFIVKNESLAVWVNLRDINIEIKDVPEPTIFVAAGRQSFNLAEHFELFIEYYVNTPKATVLVKNEKEKKEWESKLKTWQDELNPKRVLPR